MRRQINCKHFLEESKKTSVYFYKLIDRDLNLCKRCENKLRQKIIKQDKDEKSVERLMKKKGFK